jgi:hypothetical protein
MNPGTFIPSGQEMADMLNKTEKPEPIEATKMNTFIRTHGQEAYDTAIKWNGSTEGINVYSAYDNIFEDYPAIDQAGDAEDIFDYFGDDCCAVIETGDFLIRVNNLNKETALLILEDGKLGEWFRGELGAPDWADLGEWLKTAEALVELITEGIVSVGRRVESNN